MDVVDTGRRRRFSVAEKMRIVEESLAGSNLARSTARRHGIALSGLYLWRRQYRRGAEPAFRPVAFLTEPAAPEAAAHHCAVSEKIEITLANGRRLTVGPSIDTTSLTRLVQVLERA